jgi:hypothetical protein
MRLVAPLLLLAAAVGCQPRPAVVNARQLLREPSRFEGERLVIAGLVQNARKRLPAEGNGYTSFDLADGTDRVPVLAWGTEQVGSGDVVEVRGVFHSQMQAGSDVLHDVVEAAFVRPIRRALQPPGTPVSPP